MIMATQPTAQQPAIKQEEARRLLHEIAPPGHLIINSKQVLLLV
jgi:hypothetical protein